MSAIELQEMVQRLNEGLPEELVEEGVVYFEFSTTGCCDSILLNNILLWDSENDEREWDEDIDDYAETIEEYVIRRFQELVGHLEKSNLMKVEKTIFGMCVLQDNPVVVEDDGQYDIPHEDTTCYGCPESKKCEYAWDAYNTEGDCLKDK